MKLLMLAAVYGTLVGGEFVSAPSVMRGENGGVVPTWSITEEAANELGYKLLVDMPPQCASNEYAVAVGYAESDRIYRTYEVMTIEPTPRKFSKLKIYGAITQLGAWSAVEAWLTAKNVDGVNGWTAFQLSQEVSEDHPLFSSLSEEARRLLCMDAEQFEALLNACILEE